MISFFRDIGREFGDAARWLFSPHSWRLALIIGINLAFMALLMYAAISHFAYSRDSFARCPGNRNLLFIAEFFSFTFFALFAAATVGEVINSVDTRRRGLPSGSMTTMLIYSALTAACGTTALLLIMRCS